MDSITGMALTHSKTALCTKETGATTKDKVSASIPVRTATTTRVSGTRTRCMAKVLGAMMVTLTVVSGTKITCTERESSLKKTAKSKGANSKMMNSLDDE